MWKYHRQPQYMYWTFFFSILGNRRQIVQLYSYLKGSTYTKSNGKCKLISYIYSNGVMEFPILFALFTNCQHTKNLMIHKHTHIHIHINIKMDAFLYVWGKQSQFGPIPESNNISVTLKQNLKPHTHVTHYTNNEKKSITYLKLNQRFVQSKEEANNLYVDDDVDDKVMSMMKSMLMMRLMLLLLLLMLLLMINIWIILNTNTSIIFLYNSSWMDTTWTWTWMNTKCGELKYV